jgi:dTDP-4-amino-4,6-dideoxygalactose transaminase
MDEVLEIARRHDLYVVEDCGQAIGAEDGGRRVGSLGDMACFSFYPTKKLGAYGDGGMATTNNADIAERIDVLRRQGGKTQYYDLLSAALAPAGSVPGPGIPRGQPARQRAGRSRGAFVAYVSGAGG